DAGVKETIRMLVEGEGVGKDAVEAQAEPHRILARLDMDVGRLHGERTCEHALEEPRHLRRILYGKGFGEVRAQFGEGTELLFQVPELTSHDLEHADARALREGEVLVPFKRFRDAR